MRNPLDTLDTKLWASLDHQSSRVFRMVLLALVALASWAIYNFGGLIVVPENSYVPEASYTIPVVAALYALLTAASLAVLYPFLRRKGANKLHFILLGVVIMVIMLARIVPINFRSGDYNTCLMNWAEKMRYIPFPRAISHYLTDYNAPYEYFIYVIAHTPLPDIYLYKLLSMIFDLLLALLVMRIAEKYGKAGTLGALLAFLLVYIWPTFVINSAMWAQCDAIFVTLGVASVYFALENKPWRAAISIGLCLAFKLQAVFILPMMLVFWAMGKVRLKHLLAIPATYLLSMVPALLGGMPAERIYIKYLDQSGYYEDLVLDAPSVFQLFKPRENQVDIFANLGIAFALCAVLVLCLFLIYRRKSLTPTLCFDASLLMTLVIPFLLPRMHDRYFYMAETFALIYVFLHPRRFPVALLLMMASLNSYLAFLQQGDPFIPQSYAALVLLGVLCYLSIQLVRDYIRSSGTLADAGDAIQPSHPARG